MSDQPPTVDKDATLARAAELVSREDAETRAALASPKRRRQVVVGAMWALLIVNGVIWGMFPPPALDAGDLAYRSTVPLNDFLADVSGGRL